MEFRVAQATRSQRAAIAWAALFRCVQRMERAASSTSVALIIVPPRRMAHYNSLYRGKTGPTDVLAFPVSQPQARRDGSGDVVLCPTVLRQRNPRQPIRQLLAHRFVHALLHLHGYRHDTAAHDRRMEKRVQQCLNSFYGPHHAKKHLQ